MKFTTFIIAMLITIPLFGQGTYSTDDTDVSRGDASLSGTTEEEIDLREEEVQMQEEKFDPSYDNDPIEIEREQQQMEESAEGIAY